MIAVIDYGVANIGSLLNMLRRCGVAAQAITTPDEVLTAEKLILPGVGAFDNGMVHLRDLDLVGPIQHSVTTMGTPILGICLGMQLLGGGSEEGVLPGLGLIAARALRFEIPKERGLKVPHMGWRHLSLRRESPLVELSDPRTRFYFTHSFHLVCEDHADVLATAEYGVEFTAIVERGQVRGVQFHPEKSHSHGMKLLMNYATL